MGYFFLDFNESVSRNSEKDFLSIFLHCQQSPVKNTDLDQDLDLSYHSINPFDPTFAEINI